MSSFERRILTRQPHDGLNVDKDSPLAENLVYSFEPWNGNRNGLARSVSPTVAGPASATVGVFGRAFGNASANSYIDTGSGWGMGSASNGAAVIPLYPYTSSGFFIGFKPSGWFLDITASNEPRFWFGGVAAYTCSTTITPQVWQTLGITWRSGVASGTQFWLNGRKLGSAITAGTLSADSGDLFLIARASDDYAKAFFAGTLCFNAAKSDAEMAALTANPWQVYAKRRIISLPAVSSGGTVSGAGSSTLTFAATGATAATKQAAGASTLTFAPSGATSATKTAVGASTLTFGVAGAGSSVASGAAVGSSSITFAATGATSATKQASGSSSLTFGVSAVSPSTATDTPALDAGGGHSPQRRKRRFILPDDTEVYATDVEIRDILRAFLKPKPQKTKKKSARVVPLEARFDFVEEPTKNAERVVIKQQMAVWQPDDTMYRQMVAHLVVQQRRRKTIEFLLLAA